MSHKNANESEQVWLIRIDYCTEFDEMLSGSLKDFTCMEQFGKTKLSTTKWMSIKSFSTINFTRIVVGTAQSMSWIETMARSL